MMNSYSGLAIDLNNFDGQDVRLGDVAHALSKICRFNGHIERTFTVAEHSIIGSRMATTTEFAMEYLLHDSGEAYLGDIILPVKELFPEIGEFEDGITAVIFDALWPENELTGCGLYKKSPYVKQLDGRSYEWERVALQPTHVFRMDVWNSRHRWYQEYTTLLDDKKFTPLEDIFITEYFHLRDKIRGS
jgi:hypothetical protein